MRATTLMTCIASVTAIVIAASASAQTIQKKSDGGKSIPMNAQQLRIKAQGETKAPTPKGASPASPARPKNVPSTTAPKGKNMAPLTAADCNDLGGQIQINTLCNSRLSCARTDQNGKAHHVCINGK